MMTTLANLLQPYPVERFINENWTKRGIIIPGEYPGKFQNLFSWQKLNYLLNFHQLDLRFILNGQVLPTREPIDWIEQCQKGATLNISHVHQHVPELADLVWGIQQETGHKAIHTNIYSSWPAQQGSKCHYDSHEVFVMQIDGQKEWFVFEDTLKYPYTDTAEKSEYLTPPKEAPYIHRVLKPGDLLYIPRGHWHYAIAQEKPSLHVTLGMRCYTGRDAFRWLFQTLEASLQGEESWRQNLPLLTEGNTTGAEKEVQQLFKNLTVLLEQKQVDFSQQYAQYLSSRALRANRAPEISLPSQAGFDFFQQELDTILRQPKFQKIKIESLEQTEYLLITPEKKDEIQRFSS